MKEATECFSPDILHVFKDAHDSSQLSILSSKSRGPDSLSSPSSFPQFQHLPPELRCLVWEAALPEPTVVPRTWNNGKFRYNLQRKVPPVLQACAESRGLLIAPSEEFWVSAAPKYQLVQTRGRDDEGVYMDFKRDAIWVYRGYDISETEIKGYANLQSLVMNWGLRPCWVDSAVDKGVRFVQQFPKLELLTLLVDFSAHGWPEPSTLKGLRRLKRNEVKRIWSLVQKAFMKAKERDPSWIVPKLHIVHKTEHWSRQEAK
ncbi:hypothetical protein VPNG_06240 [Cytospora leucostoma]|uniref:2EXR domain-containing protein n=1 Tax=Cytospora leucostoma TaxID=1230097 RepID=A0A423WYK9_9PEZI|nr:hypothetical protein VPNG_06240 [Cytospora leucostoma]